MNQNSESSCLIFKVKLDDDNLSTPEDRIKDITKALKKFGISVPFSVTFEENQNEQ